MKAKRFLPPLNALGIQRHDACVLYRCFEKLDADASGVIERDQFVSAIEGFNENEG